MGTSAAEAVPALTRALSGPDPALRFQAAYALARIGKKAEPSVPALRSLEDDPSEDVRKAAAGAIRRILEAAKSEEDPDPPETPLDPTKKPGFPILLALAILVLAVFPWIVFLITIVLTPDAGSSLWVCRRCRRVGRRRLHAPGNLLLEIALIFLFGWLGLVYTLSRRSRRYFGCAHCGSNDIEPAEGPLAPSM